MIKNLFFTIVLLCLCVFSAIAQNGYSVKGVIVDTATNTKLTATISVLDAKDSILQKFTHTADDGSFAVTGLPAGKFLLLVGSAGHDDHIETFTLDATGKEHNWGDIKMQTTAKELKEVTIKSEVEAIKIKGDTIEYNAKAYVIQPNDRVEDLLRQLPGITIDKAGHITAQGVKVRKVLVDGEEFFGDDPTLVTRNIRADMVDKVQLYDAQSAQAKFTGIDDGVKIKTINLQLKADRKTGVFGKVDAGGGVGSGVGTGAGAGNNDYYEGQLIYNKFIPNEKFALYGTASNNGNIGLGYEDSNKIGAGDVQINDNGSSAFSFDDDDDDVGQGVPVSKTAGVHLDDKWDKNKQSINTNYKTGLLGLTTDETQLQQKTIGTSTVENTATNSHSYTNSFKQKLDGAYTNALSPTANLRLSVNAADREVDGLSNTNSVLTDGNGGLLTNSTTSQNSKDHTKILNADVFYTKRFTKPGRTLSWDVNEVYTNENKTNYFKSDRYTAIDKKDSVVDQYKPSITNSLVINNNVTYSEPITATFALTVNYGFGLDNTLQDARSYNAPSPGDYSVLDSVNSSIYKVNKLTNQLGAVFNYRWGEGTKKVLTFGTRVNDVTFKQINEYTNQTFTRDYFNWMPQVTFRNRISQGQTYNISYRGNSIQPGISELQPITSNINPLEVIVGNPYLEPSFQHTFNATYNNNAKLTGQLFNINGYISFRENPIVSKALIDTLTGITTTTYVNLNHNTPYNYRLSTSLGRKLGASGIQGELSLFTYGNVNYLYSNGILTKSNNSSYHIGARVSAYKEKAYGISLQGGPTFNVMTYSPQIMTNNNSVGFNVYASTQFFLPGKFQINSDLEDTYSGKTQSLSSVNRTMLNASFNKTFFKNDDLKLSLSCNNLLNQDENFRYSGVNTITQTSFNTIKRYFMFTVTWEFTKFKTVPVKK